MKEQQIEYISWLSSQDSHVRDAATGGFDHLLDSHAAVKMFDELFSNGLRWPLDDASSGSLPGNVINCRCTTLPAKKPK